MDMTNPTKKSKSGKNLFKSLSFCRILLSALETELPIGESLFSDSTISNFRIGSSIFPPIFNKCYKYFHNFVPSIELVSSNSKA